jgi:hypothetical protein
MIESSNPLVPLGHEILFVSSNLFDRDPESHSIITFHHHSIGMADSGDVHEAKAKSLEAQADKRLKSGGISGWFEDKSAKFMDAAELYNKAANFYKLAKNRSYFFPSIASSRCFFFPLSDADADGTDLAVLNFSLPIPHLFTMV